MRDAGSDDRPTSTLHRIRKIPDAAQTVRVLVADDHPVFREGIVRALAANQHVEVVAEAGDGRTALDAIVAEKPDVALLDRLLEAGPVRLMTLAPELPGALDLVGVLKTRE